jgi:hypothetical protein
VVIRSVSPPKPERPSRHTSARLSWQRARRPLAAVLVVLTCVAFLGSALSFWVGQTLLNTDRFVTLVAPLSSDPTVISSVSAYAADEIVTLLNVQQRVQDALPDRVRFLAVPLTNEVRNFMDTHIASVMRTQAFQQAWTATMRFLHGHVVQLLRGDARYLAIVGNRLTLDLTAVIGAALRYLQSLLPDLVQSKLPLPDLSAVQVPQAARQQLSDALGIRLPADFAQVTLLQGDQLVAAQRAVRIFDGLVWVLPLLTVALFVAALFVAALLGARDRRRTLVGQGIGVTIALLVLIGAILLIQHVVVSTVTSQPAQGIIGPTLDAVVSSLIRPLALLLVGAVALAVVAFFANEGRWFAAAYSWVRAQCERLIRFIRARVVHWRASRRRRVGTIEGQPSITS